ncbi:MAG: DUF3085 domain-containing protein [Rudaea sp.]
MPGTLVFSAKALRRIVEHIRSSSAFQEEIAGYDPQKKELIYQPGTPSLLLVHDRGVYLMSNGIPGDPEDPGNPKSSRYVVYALGCDPNKDANWYDTALDLVGGDDFGEALQWVDQVARQIEGGAEIIRISVDDNNLELLPAENAPTDRT